MHGAQGPGRPGGCSTMTTIPEFLPVPVDGERWRVDPLRLAVAGYLARYRGETRRHAESDLRVYLTWCQERGLDALAARRPHIELYVRCLLYTSDAADEEDSVDLGGRRIIKKKK